MTQIREEISRRIATRDEKERDGEPLTLGEQASRGREKEMDDAAAAKEEEEDGSGGVEERGWQSKSASCKTSSSSLRRQ